MKILKIAILPLNIASNFTLIAQDFRSMGHKVDIICFSKDKYMTYADKFLWNPKTNYLLQEFIRFLKVIQISSKYDIYHYTCGTSVSNPIYPRKSKTNLARGARIFLYWYRYLLENLEFNIIRLRKKKIYINFVGNDSRLYSNLLIHNPTLIFEAGNNIYNSCADAAIMRNIKKFDRFASEIYTVNPDLLQGLPTRTKFVGYTNCKAPIGNHQERLPFQGVLKILHAPTDKGIKGTRFIQEAVSNLRTKGLNIELELISNQPRDRVLDAINRSNLIIDQLLIGWYGAFAVEAMNKFKPVIAFINEDDLRQNITPQLEDIPIINANINNIEAILLSYYLDNGQFENNIENTFKYLIKWHNPSEVAKILIDEYVKPYSKIKSKNN